MSKARSQEKRRPVWNWPLLVAAATIGLVGYGAGEIHHGVRVLGEMAASLPPAPDIATMPVSTAVVDRNGQLLRPFTTADGRWRLPVTPEEVDRRFLDMLFAYEDQGFEGHGGVEWKSMVRAAGQYLLAGHIVSGGSTLTM